MFALLAFVITSVAFLAAKGPSEPPAPPETRTAEPPRPDAGGTPMLVKEAAPGEAKPETQATGERKVIVYYFHTTRRCFSCKTLERLAKEAITGEFGEALKSGLLEWKPLNTDKPENEHFLRDYDLYTKVEILVPILIV